MLDVKILILREVHAVGKYLCLVNKVRSKQRKAAAARKALCDIQVHLWCWLELSLKLACILSEYSEDALTLKCSQWLQIAYLQASTLAIGGTAWLKTAITTEIEYLQI